MRVYVPAVLSDLSVPLPPVRSGVLCVPEAGMSGEDIEVLEDDAITEAALSSLELARETEGAGAARVVLAVDTPTSTTLTPGEQIEPRISRARPSNTPGRTWPPSSRTCPTPHPRCRPS